MKKIFNVLLLLNCLLLIFSCKKNIDGANLQLTSLPIDNVNYKNMVPLGALNPSGHTLPTGHVYFYLTNPMAISNVYCPGNLNLIAVSQQINGLGSPTEFTEYKLIFGNRNSNTVEFAHIQTLTADIIAKIGTFPANGCEEYSTGGKTYRSCRKELGKPYAMYAGQQMGTVGGAVGIYAFDLGISNKEGDEIQILPFISDSLLNLLTPKIGNGITHRIEAPITGEFNYDIAGTAKGNWYFPGEDHKRNDKHIALVQDNILPEIPAFSIGTSLTNQTYGVFTYDKQNSGEINREFKDITADGKIYCFNLKNFGGGLTGTSFMLKLENNNTIKIEKRACDCSCNTPFSFSANVVIYNR